MDWDTGAPKPNRLDGWIVQFGGFGTDPVVHPLKVKVWALCLPDTSIPVVQTYLERLTRRPTHVRRRAPRTTVRGAFAFSRP